MHNILSKNPGVKFIISLTQGSKTWRSDSTDLFYLQNCAQIYQGSEWKLLPFFVLEAGKINLNQVAKLFLSNIGEIEIYPELTFATLQANNL
jgi:hypothetical protein